jgi:hypothetical protein
MGLALVSVGVIQDLTNLLPCQIERDSRVRHPARWKGSHVAHHGEDGICGTHKSGSSRTMTRVLRDCCPQTWTWSSPPHLPSTHYCPLKNLILDDSSVLVAQFQSGRLIETRPIQRALRDPRQQQGTILG